jgi:hypothetical protein
VELRPKVKSLQTTGEDKMNPLDGVADQVLLNSLVVIHLQEDEVVVEAELVSNAMRKVICLVSVLKQVQVAEAVAEIEHASSVEKKVTCHESAQQEEPVVVEIEVQ